MSQAFVTNGRPGRLQLFYFINKRQVEGMVGGILSQEDPIGSCSVTRPSIEVRDFLICNMSEIRI